MAVVNITGGDKLTRYLKDAAKKVANPSVLRVGFLEGRTYPDGTSVPMVAAVQNFGSSSQNIPARPFFSNMVRDEKSSWPGKMAKILEATNLDAKRTLGLMGSEIAAELRDSILEFDGVPLAPATVAAKGNDKQLIDTSVMLKSVDYELSEED